MSPLAILSHSPGHPEELNIFFIELRAKTPIPGNRFNNKKNMSGGQNELLRE